MRNMRKWMVSVAFLALAGLSSPLMAEEERSQAIVIDLLEARRTFGTGSLDFRYERASWKHASWILGGFTEGAFSTSGDQYYAFRLDAGIRLRPFEEHSVKGLYAGLGARKGIYVGTGSWGFMLDQDLALITELGWQWVLPQGFTHGPRLTAPFYFDKYTVPFGFYVEGLTWSFGYAW